MASISKASLGLIFAADCEAASHNLLGYSDQRIDLIRGVVLSALVIKACNEFLSLSGCPRHRRFARMCVLPSSEMRRIDPGYP
jgi:hypothetical protein